jgi:HK97 gp10 family phage protein
VDDVTVTVKVTGIDQVKANAIAYKEEKQKAIQAIVAESALTIQNNARTRAPVDTGRLRSSISSNFLDDGYVAEIIAATFYAGFVEWGTSPHFPPPSALSGWARRHGMAGKEFVIARGIAKKGTPAQPFLFPAFEQERNKFVEKIKTEMGKP